MKKLFFSALILGASMFTHAQQTKKVLFIGNSYTSANNLPGLIDLVAQSTGDDIEYTAHTPGGETLSEHAQNSALAQTITTEEWDFVSIQAQSQEPSFPLGQFNTETLPFAYDLVNMINNNHNCTQPVFYMTWGRENGDASNCPFAPWVCTYEGMDDTLRARYELMADLNESLVSPVGAVWRELRTNGISFNLYSGDGSHPSIYGSYAAALTFYTIFFEKDPTLVTFVPGGISSADATTIKNATKSIVFDNLSQWNVGAYDPVANFEYTIGNGNVFFSNSSEYSDTYEWTFPDGTTSSVLNEVYELDGSETYDIQLIAKACGKSDTINKIITVEDIGIEESSFLNNIYPNPVKSNLNINIVDPSIDFKVEIYNMQGQVVKTFIDKTVLPISDLSDGEYILKIKSLTSSSVTKFVKQ